jgi:hypothetical protein
MFWACDARRVKKNMPDRQTVHDGLLTFTPNNVQLNTYCRS